MTSDGVAVLFLFLLLGLGVSPARAEILAYVDEAGRRIYINDEDQELQTAVRRGGAAAALRLMERRRQSIPGIEDYIHRVSEEHSVDPRLVRAVIEVESAWNPTARSRKGAIGLMQLMPETARRFGVRDPLNPHENVAGGVRYLRYLLDRYRQDLLLALAAYNAGPTAVDDSNGVPSITETQDYVRRLEILYGTLGRGRSRWLTGNGRIYLIVEPDGRAVFINQ